MWLRWLAQVPCHGPMLRRWLVGEMLSAKYKGEQPSVDEASASRAYLRKHSRT